MFSCYQTLHKAINILCKLIGGFAIATCLMMPSEANQRRIFEPGEIFVQLNQYATKREARELVREYGLRWKSLKIDDSKPVNFFRYGTIEVPPGTELDWVIVFQKECIVEEAKLNYLDNPNPRSISHRTEIYAHKEKQKKIARSKPSDTTVLVKRSISGDQLLDQLESYYSKFQGSLSTLNSDDDFLEIIVKNIKGVVIEDEMLWEKLQITIFINEDRGAAKLAFIFDGQFAPGIGKTPPRNSAYRDIEPTYAKDLLNHIQEVVVALKKNIRKN